MGLESKEGALRALGEEFPMVKLLEIRNELQEDAMAEGALNLVRAQIQKQLMDLTGMMVGPDGTATPMDPMMLGDGDVLGDGQLGPQDPNNPQGNPQETIQREEVEGQIRETLMNEAFGDKPPARRTVDKD